MKIVYAFITMKTKSQFTVWLFCEKPDLELEFLCDASSQWQFEVRLTVKLGNRHIHIIAALVSFRYEQNS